MKQMAWKSEEIKSYLTMSVTFTVKFTYRNLKRVAFRR